jgi:hypothetical protein
VRRYNCRINHRTGKNSTSVKVFLALLIPLLVWSQSRNSAEILSTGTGFVVSTQGYVVTNNHVAGLCESIRVGVGDSAYSALLVASDTQNDLAVLKLSEPAGTVMPFREDQRLKLGENVVAIGYPLHGIVASSLNVTTGSVSALAGLHDDTRAIQFTAPVQPGNSGGPLLDQSGNVVGVVTSKLSPIWAIRATGDLPQNVNFAIKASLVREFLDSRGVQYVTRPSQTRLETTDIAETARGGVVSIQCFGSTSAGDLRKSSTVPTAFGRGVEAYQKGDYATALREWSPMAEQGEPAAQFNIGLMYFEGHGVPQDYARAAMWFERSAERDYTKAQRDLGEMYAIGQGLRRDYVHAYKWLNICAAKGDDTCALHRNEVGRKLHRSELETAQRLSAEFQPKK